MAPRPVVGQITSAWKRINWGGALLDTRSSSEQCSKAGDGICCLTSFGIALFRLTSLRARRSRAEGGAEDSGGRSDAGRVSSLISQVSSLAATLILLIFIPRLSKLPVVLHRIIVSYSGWDVDGFDGNHEATLRQLRCGKPPGMA